MIIRSIAAIVLAVLALAPVAHAQIGAEGPLPAATPKARTAAELASQTIVIYNESNRDSAAIAGFYAEKRGIPLQNMIALQCSHNEEITRGEFDRTIAEPLRQALSERGLWKVRKGEAEGGRVEESKIRFAAVIHGMPLRVAATSGYPGDATDRKPPEIYTRNEASVDSELAVLGLYTKQISGILENPVYRQAKVIDDLNLPNLLLVCRLDGPDPFIVRRMIHDSLEAEAKGLRGFTYIDARGVTEGPMKLGDDWFREAARDAREHGLPVILDNGPALFPDAYPMRHAALYLGWYNEHVAGPFARETFRFTPGAVALHLHSFSAISLRNKTLNWCAPLLARGAAATLGNVYEPYLGLTPQPQVLSQRLREGFTFAEAAYMAQPALSWMTTMVGDPLYRPFLNQPSDTSDPWAAYREGVRIWLQKDRASGEAALRKSAAKLNSGIVSEGLGLLELAGGDHRAAVEAFRAARASYKDADDRIRVAIHESSALAAWKGAPEAAAFLRDQVKRNIDNENVGILSILVDLYAPKKTAPAKKP